MRLRSVTALLLGTLIAAAGGVLASCTDESPSDTKPLANAIDTAPKRASLLDEIKNRGVVRIGVKFDVPLFGLKHPKTGRLGGFDIEIAKGLVRRIYPESEDPLQHIEFVEAISKNREKFLTERTVDLIISTYTINAARKELVDFAGPYYIAGQDILAKTSDIRSGAISGVNDVNGKKVCAVTGSTSLTNLREAAPDADTSIAKDKYSQCFAELVAGRVDAITTDDVILLGLAQGHPEFSVTGNPFHTEPYGIGIPKGDDELRSFVNDALETMMNDGTWASAFDATIGTTGALTPTPPQIDRYPDRAG